jgi:hypothetical protein
VAADALPKNKITHMKWITVIHIATEQRNDVTGPGGRCAANTAEPCQKCLKSQSLNEDMYY